jgi:glycosyltransferase 2 family protein
LKKIVQYIFIFAFAGFLVWLSIKDIDQAGWLSMKNALLEANYLLIIPVLFMAFISHWSRAMRWRLLMEPLQIAPKRFNVFAAVMIGYFANMGVPRLGEVLRCTVVARYEKAPADKLVGTIVIERAFDMFCFFVFIAITLLLESKNIGHIVIAELRNIVYQPDGSFNTTKFIISVSVFLGFIMLLWFLFTKYKHNNIIQKIKGVTDNILAGLKSIVKLQKKGAFLMHTFIIWGMYLLEIYVAFFAFKETQQLPISVACVVLTMGTFGMIATPNGLGTFPILVAQALSFYNITKIPTGTTFGWLMWAVMTVITIILGVICFIVLPRINNKTNEQSSQ